MPQLTPDTGHSPIALHTKRHSQQPSKHTQNTLIVTTQEGKQPALSAVLRAEVGARTDTTACMWTYSHSLQVANGKETAAWQGGHT